MIDGTPSHTPDTAYIFGISDNAILERDLLPVNENPLRLRVAAFLGEAFARMKDFLRAEPAGYYMDDKFPSVPLTPLTSTEVENMLRGRSDLAEQ